MRAFFQKFWAAFDTDEGVLVMLGLLWLAGIQWLHVPAEIVIPGLPGPGLGVSMVFALAVPPILAKLGWARPFQPTPVHEDAAAKSVININEKVPGAMNAPPPTP